MIRYALCCTNDHHFEAWFAGSEAFDRQAGAGQVTCPVCGSAEVGKTLMTPSVSTARNKQVQLQAPEREEREQSHGPVMERAQAQDQAGPPNQAMPVVSSPEMPDDVREMIRSVRDHVIRNADNVGEQFAEEARKIHYGERDKRGIYGQASIDEVKNLHEEGIDVIPLPILPEDRN